MGLWGEKRGGTKKSELTTLLTNKGVRLRNQRFERCLEMEEAVKHLKSGKRKFQIYGK